MASSTERRTLWVGVAILFLLGTAAFIYLESNRPKFHGVVLSPAQPAEEIQLTDDDGQSFRLSGQHGRIVLVYFGYTNCPDDARSPWQSCGRLSISLEVRAGTWSWR